jgi:hypothetical protein
MTEQADQGAAPEQPEEDEARLGTTFPATPPPGAHPGTGRARTHITGSTRPPR